MTSNEFEIAAKNACIKVMQQKFGLELTFGELEMVWFAHELGFKKCTLFAHRLGHFYPEITYNRDKDEMYVDIYQKQANVLLRGNEIDKEVHV